VNGVWKNAVTAEENHEYRTAIVRNLIQIRTAVISDRPNRIKRWFQVQSVFVEGKKYANF
jgi:hypothetical protein